jgi:hypothetical protein
MAVQRRHGQAQHPFARYKELPRAVPRVAPSLMTRSGAVTATCRPEPFHARQPPACHDGGRGKLCMIAENCSIG